MIKIFKRPLSILLAVMMVIGVIAAVPVTVSAETASYVKVTEAPTDWSGDYLIVYEDGNKALNGGVSGSEIDASNKFIDVTISNGEIASNATTNAAKVTIAACTGGYSIKLSDGSYIGGLSGSNKIKTSQTALTNSISIADGSANIVSDTSVLRFNTSWPGFRYYRASGYTKQKAIQLYKLTTAEAPATYTVTWKLDANTVIDTTEVEEGELPTHADPTKEADAQYTYTFTGWTPAISEVTEDVTYTANFNATVNEYTITWLNDDDSLIDTTTVAYGTVPTHEDPTKADDETYTYTFAGWDTTPVAVTGTATYKATFTANPKVVNYKLTVGNAENGKIVISGGILGNPEAVPGQIASDITISDGASLILLEEFSAEFTGEGIINITNGTFQFYPRSANTAVITAVPDEGYAFDGWYIGEDVYSTDPVLNYKNFTAETVLTVKFVQTYTVTWNNWNGTTIEEDTGVIAGTIPSFDGAEPTRPEDNTHTYTFAGWDTTPAAVTGDVTYTATFNAVEKALFSGHSISLNGDVDVNFYLNLTNDQIAEGEGVVITYEWERGTSSYTVSASDFVSGKGFKTIAKLPAAEMSYEVTATVFINGVEQTETNTYSIRDYALATIANPNSTPELVTLMKAMLDYGAKAQDAFGRTNTVYANEGVDYTAGEVTAAMIDAAIAAANAEETADDLNEIAAQIGADYYSSSLVFLYECTLRHYFTGSTLNAEQFDGVKSGAYYYVEKTDIPASQLDTLQTFTIGNTTFKYSALDFVKAVMAKYAEGSVQYELAAAAYRYNQAANAFFNN